MKEITITKKLKVFSIEDIKEAIQYIEEEKGYFANSEEEFECTSEMFYLERIVIDSMRNENVFVCDDGSFKLFAIIED